MKLRDIDNWYHGMKFVLISNNAKITWMSKKATRFQLTIMFAQSCSRIAVKSEYQITLYKQQ